MANYTSIKNIIQEVVRTNDLHEITGANLQMVLLGMINAVDSNNEDDYTLIRQSINTLAQYVNSADNTIRSSIANLLNYVNAQDNDIRSEINSLANSLNSAKFGYNVSVFGLVAGVHTLATAVKNVPSEYRFGGQKITFKTDAGWVTYQNTSLTIGDYEDVDNWVLDSGTTVEGDVTITNNPDYEDLTQNEGGQLKFADKEYNSASYSGLGRVYLRKNIVGGVNTLTQAMLPDANTIYIIQYDYVLSSDITMPTNCILKFDGGSVSGEYIISNGTIVLGNYIDSISNLNGEFITEDYLKQMGVSKNLSGFTIVKNGAELTAALSSPSPSCNVIFLLGDVFIISSTVTVTFTGSVVPYPNYHPQVIAGANVVNDYTQDANNTDYLVANMPNMGSGRHFYLFDGEGKNIEVQKLSDVIGTTPQAVGNITKSNSIVKILMDSRTAQVLANKSQDELKYCVLLINAGFTTVQLDKLYTDNDYIYGEFWQYEYWTEFYNYERSAYNVYAVYDIFNVPFYGGGKAFIDSNKNLHISKGNAGMTILGKMERVFDVNSTSASPLTFNGITFKGGGANTYFDGGTSSYKNFINCTFENVLTCYNTSTTPDSANILFDGCTFSNIGGTCLYLAGTDNIVRNCTFNKVGLFKKRANCIEAKGYNMLIENNYFCDFSYSAIWTGGADYNSCIIRRNIVEQKFFKSNPQKYVLRDAGGIYVLTQNANVQIIENIVRHIVCPPSGSLTYDNRGIYLDNGAYNVTVSGNIVYDTAGIALDSRYVSSMENSNINNVFNYNIIYGTTRLQGNPSATDSQKITVTENILSNEFNVTTNEYVKNGLNYFTGMSIVDDVVNCNYAEAASGWAKANVKVTTVPFRIAKNSVFFTIEQNASIKKAFYCPSMPHRKTEGGSGIYYATYKIYMSTTYESFTGSCYTLNVIFNIKNGRAALIEPTGLITNQYINGASLVKVTTQSISDANSSNKGFLLNMSFKGDNNRGTYCTVILESIASTNRYLPCSTYLIAEDAANDASVEVITVPTKRGATTDRPVFTSYINSMYIGYEYYDETLNKPVFYNGSAWIDATGATV